MMTLHAFKQEMDHIARAINLASGKDGIVFLFFFRLTLLGVHRSSASCFACQVGFFGFNPSGWKGGEELCRFQPDSWQ